MCSPSRRKRKKTMEITETFLTPRYTEKVTPICVISCACYMLRCDCAVCCECSVCLCVYRGDRIITSYAQYILEIEHTQKLRVDAKPIFCVVVVVFVWCEDTNIHTSLFFPSHLYPQ